MSLLNAIAQRPVLNPVVHGADQQNAAASAARQGLAGALMAAGTPALLAGGDRDSGNVSLSQGAQGAQKTQDALAGRVDQLGDQTIAAAQGFLQQFAASLFGDAARGASFDFDSASVSAEASLSSATIGAGAGSSAVQGAALRFDESASFVGHGTLQTRDGQSYEFDIAVDYKASVSASSASTVAAASGGNDGAQPAADPAPTPEQALVGKQLPPVKYPGSLADLFKLLGRQLDVSARDGDQDGQLSLRLIRLVNSAALLAPRAHGDAADSAATLSPAQRSRALAQYAAPQAAPAVAPAVAPAAAQTVTAAVAPIAAPAAAPLPAAAPDNASAAFSASA